jgi:crossover junction endodeoxyribonuclease RuvC
MRGGGAVRLRVLGIDPGSRFCGFGVVEDAGGARFLHVQHGVIALDAAAPIEERLAVLHAELMRALAEHRPSVVAIEDIFHSRNVRSALVLGQARGVALLAAAQSGAQVLSFSASAIKQAVTGSGRAEKDQVGRMVNVLLGIQVSARTDASDALAAAICGLLRARVPANVPSRALQGPGRMRGLGSGVGAAAEAGRGSGGVRLASGAEAERSFDPARHLAELIAAAKGRSRGAHSPARWRPARGKERG